MEPSATLEQSRLVVRARSALGIVVAGKHAVPQSESVFQEVSLKLSELPPGTTEVEIAAGGSRVTVPIEGHVQWGQVAPEPTLPGAKLTSETLPGDVTLDRANGAGKVLLYNVQSARTAGTELAVDHGIAVLEFNAMHAFRDAAIEDVLPKVPPIGDETPTSAAFELETTSWLGEVVRHRIDVSVSRQTADSMLREQLHGLVRDDGVLASWTPEGSAAWVQSPDGSDGLVVGRARSPSDIAYIATVESLPDTFVKKGVCRFKGGSLEKWVGRSKVTLRTLGSTEPVASTELTLPGARCPASMYVRGDTEALEFSPGADQAKRWVAAELRRQES